MRVKNVFLCGVLIAGYSLASVTHAEEVVGRNPDRTGGQLGGGVVAFLVGGAVGGPLGAFVAGAIGGWVGGEIQESMGWAGNRYQIRTASGGIVSLRSPNHRFALGDEVRIEKGRPRPVAAQLNAQTPQ